MQKIVALILYDLVMAADVAAMLVASQLVFMLSVSVVVITVPAALSTHTQTNITII